MVDASGNLVERYEYTPYGERTVYFSPGTNDPDCHAPTLLSRRWTVSGVAQPHGLNEFGHQGLAHDEAFGKLIHNRTRELDGGSGRFLQPDPLGYPDGLSRHVAYHLQTGGLDPLGLTPTLAGFSGINSGAAWRTNQEAGKSEDNYIYNALRDKGYDPDAPRSFNSRNGIDPINQLPFTDTNDLTPAAGRRLDREARDVAEQFASSHGELCAPCSPVKVRVLMLQPKTATTPPRKSCCDMEVKVIWSPHDPVERPGEPESEERWRAWGEVHTVDPGGFLFGNHSSVAVLGSKNAPDVPVIRRGEVEVHQPRPGSGMKGYGLSYERVRRPGWVPTGATVNIDNILGDWMKAENSGYVFVCHSQGCNNLMHVLNRACPPKE